MNEMLERIAKVIDEGGPYYIQMAFKNKWNVFQEMPSGCADLCRLNLVLYSQAENECERLNREWVARRVVEVMKEATTFQQNNYYEMALKEGCGNRSTFPNAIWERAIDAILKDD